MLGKMDWRNREADMTLSQLVGADCHNCPARHHLLHLSSSVTQSGLHRALNGFLFVLSYNIMKLKLGSIKCN